MKEGEQPAQPVDKPTMKYSDKYPKLKNDIADILRRGITFSGQTGDFVIHGAINELIEYIDSVSRSPERGDNDGWISVEDRLPEHEQRVLFLVKETVNVGSFFIVDEWGRDNKFCNGAYLGLEWVTHWQPIPSLPKPPKQ